MRSQSSFLSLNWRLRYVTAYKLTGTVDDKMNSPFLLNGRKLHIADMCGLLDSNNTFTASNTSQV